MEVWEETPVDSPTWFELACHILDCALTFSDFCVRMSILPLNHICATLSFIPPIVLSLSVTASFSFRSSSQTLYDCFPIIFPSHFPLLFPFSLARWLFPFFPPPHSRLLYLLLLCLHFVFIWDVDISM